VQLVDWLERSGHERVILVDNASTYPPLLEYFRSTPHEFVELGENLGHRAVWEADLLTRFEVDGPFVLTDPDVVPVEECPLDAVEHLLEILERHPEATKVGLGLQIDDLPAHFALREHVIGWEAPHWAREVEPGVFDAPIDTTFAVYLPRSGYSNATGLRTGPPYVARHLAWYVDSSNLGEEELYYRRHARSDVTSWNSDRLRGELDTGLRLRLTQSAPSVPGHSAWPIGRAPELLAGLPGHEAALLRPRFSLLMPTLGDRDPDRVLGAIGAVLEQDYADWELIIKAPDDSGLLSLLPDDPRITLVEGTDRNRAHAVNIAMQRATGDVFHWINDNDCLLPGTLTCVAESLRDAMWLRGRVEVVDEHGNLVRIDGDTPWDLELLKRQRLELDPGAFWRRECVAAIGSFDGSVPLASDFEYWQRLGERWEPRTVDAVVTRKTEYADELINEIREAQAAQVRARYGRVQYDEALRRAESSEAYARELEGRLRAYEESEWWRLKRSARALVVRFSRRRKHAAPES
jgi:hypothetical protein